VGDAPADIDHEPVDALVVGQLGEGAVAQRGIEIGVEDEAPGFDLLPGDLTPFDGKEPVPVLADVDSDDPPRAAR
jgi:hypothetical protein